MKNNYCLYRIMSLDFTELNTTKEKMLSSIIGNYILCKVESLFITDYILSEEQEQYLSDNGILIIHKGQIDIDKYYQFEELVDILVSLLYNNDRQWIDDIYDKIKDIRSKMLWN